MLAFSVGICQNFVPLYSDPVAMRIANCTRKPLDLDADFPSYSKAVGLGNAKNCEFHTFHRPVCFFGPALRGLISFESHSDLVSTS